MGFWSDIRKKIIETCIEYGEYYADVCASILEDISELQFELKRKKGGGGS